MSSKENDEKKEQFPTISHSIFGNAVDSDERADEKPEDIVKKFTMPLFVRCPICQEEFKQKSTLLQHGCIHIESRPYPCLWKNCGRRFRQASHLNQHLRIHTNSKPYPCPFQDCNRCFRQRTILNQHIRIHTNSKPYRCTICFREFRQQAILTQHVKTHQSHRPFSCPLTDCKRRFTCENVSCLLLLSFKSLTFLSQELKRHIEHHMNPSKPKKNSSKATNVTNHFPQPTVYHQTFVASSPLHLQPL